MPVSQTPITDPDPPKLLTEEEKHARDKKNEQEDIFRADQGIAKFKIELMFTKEFSITKPVPGVMSFWESGAKLHGGGDAILHFCPGKKKGVSNCEHYIPDPNHGYGFLVCPGCNKVWSGDEVYGQVIGRHTAQQWTELICSYFRRLGMNCDVVIKYYKSDIRNATRQRHNSDSLLDVRSPVKRLRRIYKLSSLLQDMSTGSALYDRILAFVRA